MVLDTAVFISTEAISTYSLTCTRQKERDQPRLHRSTRKVASADFEDCVGPIRGLENMKLVLVAPLRLLKLRVPPLSKTVPLTSKGSLLAGRLFTRIELELFHPL